MRNKLAITVAMAALAFSVTGCGPRHPAASAPPLPVTAVSSSTAPTVSAAPPARHPRARRERRHPPRAAVPAGVPMPNRALTPGAIQSSDTAAICTPGWAEAHRDVSYATEDQVAAEYGLPSHDGYEIDHLIPLELGGSNSVRNLWPEPYNSRYGANQKDGLEDYLHQQVCDDGLPLAAAQHEIAVNWYPAWVAAGRPLPQDFGYGPAPAPSTRPSSPAPAPGAWCTASASYNASYGDYDVYVHSNQPDKSATASGGGYSHSYGTDGSGYADVYLRGPRPGQLITVTVGGATCSTTAG